MSLTWALVTDGHSRAAVAGVRALARAGIPVRVMATGRASAAMWSRHATARSLGPSSSDEPAFAARIAELAREFGPIVVFPGQEQAVGALARHSGALPAGALLPFPDSGRALALSDKSAVAALSTAAGIGPPATLAAGPAGALAADPPPAPCVVKARNLSRALPLTRVCETDAELAALLRALPADEEMIVQERATGALVALSLVLDRDGALAARFQSRAVRLWPAAAGPSSLSVSVAPDPWLVDRAAAMLRDAGWWGMAHMQFLETARGPSLIDVNVRFYGSLPLATAAGVNLPAIWHRVTVGGPPSPPPPYAAGVRYRWLEGELAAAVKGEPRRLVTPPARGGVGAMWSAQDPVPGVLLGIDAARAYGGGAVRRIARLRANGSRRG